jgi:hypothetical protein
MDSKQQNVPAPPPSADSEGIALAAGRFHFDATTALVPLDPDAGWETPEELPETFPFGI